MKKILLLMLLPVAMPVWNLSAAGNKLSLQDNLPRFQIYGSAGGAMWTTPLYLPDGSATPTMFGRELQAGISYSFMNFYSIGLVYSDHKAPYSYMGIDCNAGIQYVALTFGVRGKVSEHWVLSYLGGFGLANFTDSANGIGEASESGSGMHMSLGADYLLTRHIAIGADLQYTFIRMGESDPDAEVVNGVKRLGATLGIKFYF